MCKPATRVARIGFVLVNGGNQGAVNLQNNAQATSNSLSIARTLTLTNSTTDATLNVNSGGGLTTTGFIRVGNVDGNVGTGTINLAGTGTTTINNTGTLNVTNGGVFNANGNVNVNVNVNGGTVNALGGSFTVDSDLVVDSNGELNLLGSDFTLGGTPITGLSIAMPPAITDRDATLAGLFADGLPFSFDLNATAGLAAR